MRRRRRFVVSILLAAFTSLASFASGQGRGLAEGLASASAMCLPEDPKAAAFRPGDRITITQYERIDPDPNDRMPSNKTPYPSFRLRAEVSGDFDVAEDGTISIPIFGQFQASAKSVEELRDAIARSFEATLGHVGVVTIAVAEHQPIYVDGVVKSPGAYKYTPGLTAMHAVSLAGGYQDLKLDSLQFMQETNTGEQAKQSLARLLVRQAVLKAELNGTGVLTPPVLQDLVDESRAREMIAAQVAERKTVLEATASQEKAETELIESAKRALSARKTQIGTLDSAIEARDERLKNLDVMKSKGLTSDFMYESAQAEYMDTLSRRQDADVGIQQSEDQLNNAQSVLKKIELDARFALQHEIADLDLQVSQQSIIYRSHLATVSAVNADPSLSPSSPPLVYELVRRTAAGSVGTFQIKGTCLLQPGDLVRVYPGVLKPQEDVVSK